MASVKLDRSRPRTSARLFLCAAIAVVLLIAVQTLLALRSQRQMSARVLRDHAATALWYFEQNLEAELNTAIECAFHDALHVRTVDGQPLTMRSGVAHLEAVTPDRVLAGWSGAGECSGVHPGVPAAVYRFGPGSAIMSAGLAASNVTAAELRQAVEAGVRGRPPIRRTDGILAARLAGEPRLVFYSLQLLPDGEAIFAAPIDARGVELLFGRALRDFRLLPPPVLPDSARHSALRLVVGTPGAALFRTRADGLTVAAATRALPPAFGGLFVTAEILPAGAALLAPPSSATAQLSGMILLLVVSLALVALGYRQLRREQELAELRGDFVASVSHELRTPLALQRIFLDTIRLGRAATPERLAWALDNIDREARRLEHLVSNVLHFSRSERGGLDLDPCRMGVASAVAGTAAVFRPLADQRSATIDVQGDSAIAAELDEAAFHQALGNVLENAIKYGPDGQCVRVRVTAAGPWAHIDVEDEGPGLPEDEWHAVLEPFRRGRGTRGAAAAGSGIGLAVVRQIVLLHGGTVALGNAATGGLRVRITLPIAAEPIADPEPPRNDPAATSAIAGSAAER